MLRNVFSRHLPFAGSGRRFCTQSTEPVIGIDLGTTNSCVAVMDGNEPCVIANEEGERTTPSVISWIDDRRIVGTMAKSQAAVNPQNTLYATKRLIGRQYDDPFIKELQKSVSYKITKASNGDAWCSVNGKQISPSEAASYVLTKMKETAESYLEKPVRKAVVTVPAYFNDAQRQSTKDAGIIAGLDIQRIINEPTAAALSYGIGVSENMGSEKKTIAVYDLGGGTFDISILELADNVFQVKATNGDTLLGGEDFDIRVLDHLKQELEKKEKIDLSNDLVATQRLREAAEKAKKELSSSSKANINIPYIANKNGTPVHLNTTITREKYEKLVDDLIKRTIVPCEVCFKDAQISKREIDEVLLVGGMTRTPRVVEAVEKFYSKTPFKGVNPDESVAMGAAIQGTIIQGKFTNLILLDVTPLSLGTSVVGGIFAQVIKKNTAIPCKATNTFTTVEDAQTQISFDVLQGEREMAADNKLLGNFVLRDIPPLRKGTPKIDVTFDIDANGIVHVTARDRGSGRQSDIRVRSSGGLSDAEIQRMLREAEQYADEDKKRKNLSEAKNQAESAIYDCNETLSEHKKLVRAEDESKIKEAIQVLEQKVKDENSDEIQQAITALKEEQFRVFEAAYKSQSKQ